MKRKGITLNDETIDSIKIADNRSQISDSIFNDACNTGQETG